MRKKKGKTWTVPFILDENDRVYYNKYWEKIEKLFHNGDYKEAIRICDTILEEDSKVEFALIMKAHSLYNIICENHLMGKNASENPKATREKAIGSKVRIEEVIVLVNQALQINPYNQQSKQFISFYNKLHQSLRDIDDVIEKSDMLIAALELQESHGKK